MFNVEDGDESDEEPIVTAARMVAERAAHTVQSHAKAHEKLSAPAFSKVERCRAGRILSE